VTTPPGQNPAPGWYPDPEAAGGQRYWDGTQWTEHRSAPAPVAPAGPIMIDPNAKQWALFAHLSALLLGWVGPLIIYLVKKEEHPFIADQSREALNFNLSVLLYFLIGGVATFVLTLIIIGLLLIPVLIAMGVAWLVLVILAAVRANSGEAYRYPLTIRFVN
jgi:uncharacterized Tic20 family protein